MSDVPPTIAGLTVHEQIGRGGFATVWRATDDALGRSVAVKVLSTRATDDETAMRFERECRALGAVSGHPNIVTVHQIGQTPEGYPYLVMGYEPGGSFADRIASAPLDWAEAAEVGAAVADALAVAHQAEVKHRDVKPDNILIGDYGNPKLADFGIARLAGGTYTKSGSITASVAHAPPEVLHGRSPDNSADIYSLCSTLYELITGRPPFFNPADESMIPLIGRISTQPAPRLPPPVPDALNDLLAWGMAKNPADRPQTATELAAQLRAVTSGGVVSPGSVAAAAAGPTRTTWSPPPTPQPQPLPTSGQPGPTTGPTTGPTMGQTKKSALPTAQQPRWPWIVTTSGLVVAAVIAGAIIWPLISDNGTEDTGSTQVPSDEETAPPSEDDTGQATSPTSNGEDDVGTTTTDEDETASTPSTAVGDVGSLSEVLLMGADLADGPVQTLEDNSAESSDDPDHPLQDYAYCNVLPDLAEVGAGANRVLTPDFLSTSALVGSTVSVASSPEAAEAVIDDIVANANTCEQYSPSLLPVTIVSATRNDDGGEVELLVSGGGLTPDAPVTALLTAVDNLVVTLEIDPESPERDRLWALTTDRAMAYASSAG